MKTFNKTHLKEQRVPAAIGIPLLDNHVGTVAPYLRSCFAIITKAEDVVPRFNVCRDLHSVLD